MAGRKIDPLEPRPGGEYIVRGWKNILKYCPFQKGKLEQNFREEMLEAGFVFKSYVGTGRRELIWSYPQLVMGYFAKKQAISGIV